MEALNKLLLSEWLGAPILIWLVGDFVVLLLGSLRVPFRIKRKNKKEEFIFETKLPPKRNDK